MKGAKLPRSDSDTSKNNHSYGRFFQAIKHGTIFFGTYFLSIFGYLKMHWQGKKEKKWPILLIHGYLNSNLVWLYFGKQLKNRGFGPIYTINLGWPFGSIENYAQKVALKVEKIKEETGKAKVILVGHSMGGLEPPIILSILKKVKVCRA